MDLCHCCMCKRAEKTTQSAVWGRGGVLPYIVKVCVQLYKQEGSLCAFLGLQQHSLTVRSKRGSGYWCLSSLGLSYYTSINYNH